MSLQKRVQLREKRRKFRVRNKLNSESGRVRVSVFRSAKHIYAQLIDDQQHKTLFSGSTLNLEKSSNDKKDLAKKVGLELGKAAVQNNVKDVFFDRGHYLYHGRVKALADGLREAGLNF